MSQKLEIPNPRKKHIQTFYIPPYRQLSAGPTNSSPQVLNAMLFQPLTPFNKDCFKLYDDIQEMLKYVYQTKNPMTFVAQTSGNGGNEAVVTNLADPGDKVIVVTSGVWGLKVADMARRYNLNVITLRPEQGEVFKLDYLEQQIIEHEAKVLFVTHGESSTGVLHPLEGLGKICHKHDCLLAVDAIVTMAVVPLFVDRWEIDAVTGGSQKGLGAPAGIVLMSFSSRAHKRMLEKKKPPPYIFDMLQLADVWNCFGNTRKWHYTYGTPILAATRQALAEICEEGLENVWNRHKASAELFLSKLDDLGMCHAVEKPENRFCGVSCVVLPKGVDIFLLFDYLFDKHEIEISFGIGPSAGKVIRIGLMAMNAKAEVVENFVKALKDGIDYCRSNGKISDEEFIKILRNWAV